MRMFKKVVRHIKILSIIGTFVLAAFHSERIFAAEFFQLPGVIHVQTTFDGAGHYSLEELVSLSKENGLEVLVTADHDLQVMEYGIFPLRNLIKRREKRDSVLEVGPDRFLAQIARINTKQKDVLVIPGVQSSPFYYWKGNPLGKSLTAYDYRKELLLIGMRSPEDYEGLPLLHSGFSTRYTKKLLPRSVIFFIALVMSVYLVTQKGILRIFGGIIGILSLALLINHHPFQSSLLDPYHGDQGIKPFQELIDYVNERNGLVFWAHPESNYAVNGVPLGPATLMTKHYPDDLIASKGYTGFEAIYGDNITITNPGMHWDRILNLYCSGQRDKPIWGISGADFRGGREDETIDYYQTIFWVREKKSAEILESLSKGRFYAVRKGRGLRLSLDLFTVINEEANNSVISGEEIDMDGSPVIECKLSASDGGHHGIKATLIRGGKIIKVFQDETPMTFRFSDKGDWTGKAFYRLEVHGPSAGLLLSNPIFVVKG